MFSMLYIQIIICILDFLKPLFAESVAENTNIQLHGENIAGIEVNYQIFVVNDDKRVTYNDSDVLNAPAISFGYGKKRTRKFEKSVLPPKSQEIRGWCPSFSWCSTTIRYFTVCTGDIIATCGHNGIVYSVCYIPEIMRK